MGVHILTNFFSFFLSPFFNHKLQSLNLHSISNYLLCDYSCYKEGIAVDPYVSRHWQMICYLSGLGQIKLLFKMNSRIANSKLDVKWRYLYVFIWIYSVSYSTYTILKFFFNPIYILRQNQLRVWPFISVNFRP